MMLMTSWAVKCDIYYLEPKHIQVCDCDVICQDDHLCGVIVTHCNLVMTPIDVTAEVDKCIMLQSASSNCKLSASLSGERNSY